jgi:hypothetical protein
MNNFLFTRGNLVFLENLFSMAMVEEVSGTGAAESSGVLPVERSKIVCGDV